MRLRILSCVLFGLLLSLPCAAQDLVPFIRLSVDEVAKAKQLAQSLKDAQERSNRSKVAWGQFQQAYQAAHANLENVKFTDDFALAVARVYSPTARIFQAASIELAAEERKKLENLRKEMIENQQSQKQAENAWQDFQYQLVIDHVNISNSTGYNDVTLSTGKQARIPFPWNGIVFTTDFKLALPSF